MQLCTGLPRLPTRPEGFGVLAPRGCPWRARCPRRSERSLPAGAGGPGCHTCAVSEGAGRWGALTTLALRNTSLDGPRVFPPRRVDILRPWRVAAAPRAFGGRVSGRDSFGSWQLSWGCWFGGTQCDPLSIVFLHLFPWSLGSGAAGRQGDLQ